MATGRSTQLTKQIGEYLVCAELCRRRLISTTFTGNLPAFDIVAVTERLQAIPIQVKTISGASWQFNARAFLEITISKGRQKVRPKTHLAHPNLIWIFVKLNGHNGDEFYLCRNRDVQRIIYSKYSAWVVEKKGRRPRNPQSTHCAIWPKDLARYKDRWEVINKI